MRLNDVYLKLEVGRYPFMEAQAIEVNKRIKKRILLGNRSGSSLI
jgi:hypothetical protein